MKIDSRALTTAIDSVGNKYDPLAPWHICLFLGCAAALIAVIKKAPVKFTAKLLWGYMLMYALVVVEFPFPRYGIVNTPFQAMGGQSFAEILLLPYLALRFPHWIKRAIPWVIGAEIIFIWFHVLGLMRAPSFDLAFIALCFPVLPWGVSVLALITILTHHGSTALTIVFVQWLAVAYVAGNLSSLLLRFGPFIALAGYLFQRQLLMGMQSRFEAWHRIMSIWWHEPLAWLVGLGPGSFMWPSFSSNGWKEPYFMFMHNDWLQILFETGVIGLLLVLIFVSRSIYQARKNPELLAAMLGACAFAATYSPLEFMPSSVVIAWIFLGLREKVEI